MVCLLRRIAQSLLETGIDVAKIPHRITYEGSTDSKAIGQRESLVILETPIYSHRAWVLMQAGRDDHA
jgi:hypothetical protein